MKPLPRPPSKAPRSQDSKAPILRVSGKAKPSPEDFLRSILADGPKSTQEIFLEARNLGISKTSLYDVRPQLEIISFIKGARGSRCAFWQLPKLQDSKPILRKPLPRKEIPEEPKRPPKIPLPVVAPRKSRLPNISRSSDEPKHQSERSEGSCHINWQEREQMELNGIDPSDYD